MIQAIERFPSSRSNIPFAVLPGSELNISGGEVGATIDAESGSEVNISGGEASNLLARSSSEVNISGGVLDGFNAFPGSEFNISGGFFNGFHTAQAGSEVTISGGHLGFDFDAQPGSNVELIGGDFRLNGEIYDGSTITFGQEFIVNDFLDFHRRSTDVFTGVLQDGSPFIFSPSTQDFFSEVTLTRVPLPEINTDMVLVDTPFQGVFKPGQTITVVGGGVIEPNTELLGVTLNFEATGVVNNLAFVSNIAVADSEFNIRGGFSLITRAFDSDVNISGGVVQEIQTVNGELNISGGEVGRFIASGSVVNITGGEFSTAGDAFDDSVINISGGSLGDFLTAFGNSEINISGGDIGRAFVAGTNSVVTISGGEIGESFRAHEGSDVTISGGQFGARFTASPGSDVELIGGEFRLNGEIYGGSTITLAEGDFFSGLLQDGSGFIFGSEYEDVLNDVTLTRVSLPTVAPAPILVDSQNTSFLNDGQTLTVVEGGSVGFDSEIVNSTVNIEDGVVLERTAVAVSEVNISGGVVGRFFDALPGSVVNISGGDVGVVFDAFSESVVNISGGEVGSSFNAKSGSEVNISGGEVGSFFDANSGSEVNISGGDVGFRFEAKSGSEVNISGGSIGDFFDAESGSEVNLFVREFQIDGVPQLVPANGEGITITDRDVALSGQFNSGETFSFDLNSEFGRDEDFFSPDATLTVTLVGSTVTGIPTDVTVLENTASTIDLSSINVFTNTSNNGGPFSLALVPTNGTFTAPTGSLAGADGGTLFSFIAPGPGGGLFLSGSPENINAFLDDVSNLQYTGLSGVSGNDAAVISVLVGRGDNLASQDPIRVDITELQQSSDDSVVVEVIEPTNGSPITEVRFDITIREEDIVDGELRAWTLDTGYTGNDVSNSFVNGANGPTSVISRSPFTVGNTDFERQQVPELRVGDTITIHLQFNGVTPVRSDFAPTFLDADPAPVVIPGSDVNIASIRSQDWGTGYLQELSITNLSDQTADGWSVLFSVPDGLEYTSIQVWNADAEILANGDILFTSKAYNSEIAPDQARTFGFVLQKSDSTDFEVLDENFSWV